MFSARSPRIRVRSRLHRRWLRANGRLGCVPRRRPAGRRPRGAGSHSDDRHVNHARCTGPRLGEFAQRTRHGHRTPGHTAQVRDAVLARRAARGQGAGHRRRRLALVGEDRLGKRARTRARAGPNRGDPARKSDRPSCREINRSDEEVFGQDPRQSWITPTGAVRVPALARGKDPLTRQSLYGGM